MSNTKYVIVQHSAFGYKGDPAFKHGLESRSVVASQIAAVKKVGGVVFDDYMAAEVFCEEAMYPTDAMNGLIPFARGTFAAYQIDGLAVYIPFKMDGSDD